MTIEVTLVVAIVVGACAVIGTLFTIIRFWMAAERRATEAEAEAQAANVSAKEARDIAKAASERVSLLAAEFGMYREFIAREYTHKETLRDFEDRLTRAVESVGERLDDVLKSTLAEMAKLRAVAK